jgi:hypothetical protein
VLLWEAMLAVNKTEYAEVAGRTGVPIGQRSEALLYVSSLRRRSPLALRDALGIAARVV